jgi:hypothetical protein
MVLTLKDRLLLVKLFPKKGNLLEQIALRDISKKIEIDSKERTQVGLKVVNGNLTWNPKKTKEKEINFTDLEKKFLKEQVTRLDLEKSITPDILDLCIRIKENSEGKLKPKK